jgi:hypothetical protein
MLTRTLLTLTLLFISTTGATPAPTPAAHQERPRHARIVDDLEGCRVPPPSPEPVAPASCTDEGQP